MNASPPPPAARRAARSLDEALEQALEDLEGGLTPLQILDRYPEYEAELAPLIETAYRLRTTRWPTLSLAARVAGRERMHEALGQHRPRRRSVVPPLWRQLGAGAALALLAGMTFFASPVSPLRTQSRPRPAATILIAPPATWTATWTVQPSPTPEPSPTNTLTPSATPSATRLARRTPEPTEEANRLKDLTRKPPTAAALRAIRVATPTPAPPPAPTAEEEPEKPKVQPPTATPKAPPVEPTKVVPEPGKPPRAPATPEPPKPAKTRKPTEPSKTPPPSSSSSAIQAAVVGQKAAPAGAKANGVGPARERRDAAQESRKAEPPGKGRKR